MKFKLFSKTNQWIRSKICQIKVLTLPYKLMDFYVKITALSGE